MHDNGLDFIKQNQELRSFEIVTVIFLVMAALGVILYAISNSPALKNKQIALNDMRSIAQEIKTQEIFSKEKMPDGKGRGPAFAPNEGLFLEGSTGEDPWGGIYRVKLLKNALGQKTHVLIWSAGPNLRPETPERDFLPDAKGEYHVKYNGDDIGIIVKF